MRVSLTLATSLALGLATALPEALQPRGNPCKSECQKNACMKAVIAENGYPFAYSASRDCASYLATTVTPYAATTTVTVRPTVTVPGSHATTTVTTTATATLTDVGTQVVETTVYTPSTSVVETDTTTTSTTTSLVNVNYKRSLTILPSQYHTIPKYASKCANADAYKSACRCIYAQTHTVTAAKATKTVTVTKDAQTVTGAPGGTDTTTATTTGTVETSTTITTTSTDFEPSLVPATTTTTTTTTITVTPTPTFYITSPQAPTGYFHVDGNGGGFFYTYLQSAFSSANLFYLNKQAVPISVANAGNGFTYGTQGQYSFVVVTDLTSAVAAGGTTLPCTIGPGPYTVGQTGSFSCTGPGGYSQYMVCSGRVSIAQNTSPAGCSGPTLLSSLQFTITAVNYGP